MRPEALALAIETSCDETAAAVVARDGRVRSSVVASQAALHARYGGVVPELAARRHVEAVLPAVDAALTEAAAGWRDLAFVAVTRGPGLPAALLVGLAAAKALAFARDLPLVGVNHLAGHVWAHRLDAAPRLPRPAVCLVASGSHTDLCLLPEGGGLRLLGTTVDDAAGEVFDKVARLLDLGYPGGPAIERAARQGDAQAVAFPRTLRALRPPAGRAQVVGGPYAFSFSGLKTAVAVRREARPDELVADVAASFQAAVVDTLVRKTLAAAGDHGAAGVLLAGGVAANGPLRTAMAEGCARAGLALRVPPPWYCTDNAAMIGAAGWEAWAAGRRDGWDLDAEPDLPLEL